MRRIRHTILASVALAAATPAWAAGGKGPVARTDVRAGAYGYMLTAEDAVGAEGSQQVGATLKVRHWGQGWRARVALEERTAVAGPDPHGRPGETGARVPHLEGTVEALGMAWTAGRFQGPTSLGHLRLDGVSVAKELTEGLTTTVFGGRLPLSADLGHVADDQGEAVGASMGWRSGRGVNAEVAGATGRRQAVLSGGEGVSEPQRTQAFAAQGAWRVSPLLTLSGSLRGGDRIRLRMRNAAAEGLVAATEEVDVVDMDLFTAHLRARLRLSKTLRITLSGQRLQAQVFNDGRGDEDAFHDVAARARWRFWGPAAITLRARRRLRPEDEEDDDRVTGFLSLDDALSDGMILNGGVTRDAGGGFDKTRSNAEAGWRMEGGGGALFEAAATFTWIRRDNADGDDLGYSAASLTDVGDPLSAFALALAPNDTAGVRATWLSRRLFLTLDAARDLGSAQTWGFLHAGWRWR